MVNKGCPLPTNDMSCANIYTQQVAPSSLDILETLFQFNVPENEEPSQMVLEYGFTPQLFASCCGEQRLLGNDV